MSNTLAALLPVFLLIVAGFVLRHGPLSEESHRTGIRQLVYFVMLPAPLIDTLARAPAGLGQHSGIPALADSVNSRLGP